MGEETSNSGHFFSTRVRKGRMMRHIHPPLALNSQDWMTIPQDQSHIFGGDLAWLVMEFHLFVSENMVDPI